MYFEKDMDLLEMFFSSRGEGRRAPEREFSEPCQDGQAGRKERGPLSLDII